MVKRTKLVTRANAKIIICSNAKIIILISQMLDHQTISPIAYFIDFYLIDLLQFMLIFSKLEHPRFCDKKTKQVHYLKVLA